MQANKPWTRAEVRTLRKYYQSITLDQMCRMLPGRTRAAIQMRASLEGVSRKQDKFSVAEDEIILKHYPRIGGVGCATMIARPSKAIVDRAKVLGVRIDHGALTVSEYREKVSPEVVEQRKADITPPADVHCCQCGAKQGLVDRLEPWGIFVRDGAKLSICPECERRWCRESGEQFQNKVPSGIDRWLETR